MPPPPPDSPAPVPLEPDLIIQGLTRSGGPFRPSDWADRLCGVLSTFGGDQQMRYSPFVQPVMVGGIRCVIVKRELGAIEPRAWRFLFDFATDNELVVLEASGPGGPAA